MRMKIARALCLLALPFVGAAFANPPPAEYKFTRRLPNSEVREEIKSATYDDLEVCISLKGFASDGEHIVSITVYDASGREVAQFTQPVQAKGATWRAGACPNPIADVDAPGEWWFVVTLDDTPVVSASIPIAYGKPKPSVRDTPPPKSPPRPRDPRATR